MQIINARRLLRKVVRHAHELADQYRPKTTREQVDLFLNLSTLCNYACVFCNRDIEKQTVLLDDIARMEELVAHAKSVDITGYGEVTFHKDFERILKFFSSKNVPVRFVTNGSLLTQEKTNLLIQSSIKEIVFSLNTLNHELYPIYHGGSQHKLQRVIDNLDRLLAAGPSFPVRLSFVLSQRNFHEVRSFIDFAAARKVASMSCLGLTPTLKEMYTPDLIIENSAANREYLDEMREYARKRGVTASICDLNNQQTVDAPIEPARLRRMIAGCDWVHSKAFIEPDGGVYPCCWSRQKLGDIREQSFDEIWHGADYQQLRRDVQAGSAPGCGNCRRSM